MNKKHGSHFKTYFVMYLIGLGIYLLTLLVDPFNLVNINHTLLIVIYYLVLFLSGVHVIGEGIYDTIYDTIKKKRFYPNVHLLMTLAAIGAIIIGHYHEAVILILIFAGAHFLEDIIQNRSKAEIEKLINLNPPSARLIKSDGSIEIVDSSELKIDDLVMILNGDEVPSDGIIIEGETELNEANITGEAIPVYKKIGDQVYGSTINESNRIKVRINKNSDETVVAKIVELVSQTQDNITPTAKLIKKIEPIYVTVALIFAPIFYLLGNFVLNWGHDEAFYRTMVYLIGVSPCALAVTDIPATLSALSSLAKRGVLFKGGSYLASLNDVKKIAFDKTGTLTSGIPVVTDVIYLEENKLYDDLVYSMEKGSNHPLAVAIINKFEKSKDLSLEVENLIGVGVKAKYQNNEYKIAKPSYFDNISDDIINQTNKLQNEGKTVTYFSENNNIKIIIAFVDELKETSIDAIKYFNENNIETIMVTGDATNTANSVAKKLNINKVYANVLPQEKSKIVTELKTNNNIVTFVGDGINDAPALANANLGIAMNSGTDLAVEVADGILMRNNLLDLAYTHKVSKKLRKVVIQNIFFALFVVLFLVVTNLFTNLNMPLAVLIHEGSTVVVILSGLRLLRPIKTKINKY